MQVVRVKWVGVLSPCLHFPITLNLISPNQELSPLPLRISDCTAHVSAPYDSAVYHWFLCCCCTSPVPTLCISLSGRGFLQVVTRWGCRGLRGPAAAPQPAWWALPALAQPGWRGQEDEEGPPSAPVWAAWIARWASAGQAPHASAERDYDNVECRR